MTNRLIRIKLNKNLYGTAYLTDKKSVLGTIIHLSGFPGQLGKNELGEILSKAGYTVIQPFYYGSFDSGRVFSIENCFYTLQDTIKSVEKNQIIDIYNDKKILTKGPVILIGNSFGTNIIQSYPGKFGDINKVIMISSVPIVPDFNNKFGFNPSNFVGFVKKAFPRSYRIKDSIKLENEFSSPNSLLSVIKLPDNMEILQIFGKDDYIPKKIINQIYSEKNFGFKAKVSQFTVPGNHSLDSMNQVKIAIEIENFLKK